MVWRSSGSVEMGFRGMAVIGNLSVLYLFLLSREVPCKLNGITFYSYQLRTQWAPPTIKMALKTWKIILITTMFIIILSRRRRKSGLRECWWQKRAMGPFVTIAHVIARGSIGIIKNTMHICLEFSLVMLFPWRLCYFKTCRLHNFCSFMTAVCSKKL